MRAASSFFSRYAGRTYVHLILIALLGLLAYSNTFHVPFQWDDVPYIIEIGAIKDLANFIEPSKAKDLLRATGYDLLDTVFQNRFIGFMTIALNYHVNGLNVTGYHIVNLTVHIVNALLVYLLVMLAFKGPQLEDSELKNHAGHIALFSALLFVSHPLQTQAVTYICQRFTSLAAMFYLLSVSFYMLSRLSGRSALKYGLFALSVASAVLAMKTKENTLTLPFVIALFEFIFLKGPIKKRLLYIVPFMAAACVAFLTIMDAGKPLDAAIGEATRHQTTMSRASYLFTQFRVIATYLRLLAVPINQNLDYDYPIFFSFREPEVFLSFLFIFSLVCAGGRLLCRSRTNKALRIMSFGIIWFFITLSVESSVFPLVDVIFEHRLYLPSAGIFLAFVSGAFLLTGRTRNGRLQPVIIASLVFITLVFSAAAYLRNAVWQSRVSLWQDVAEKSPKKARGHFNLSKELIDIGDVDRAMRHLQTAVSLKPDYADAHNNLGGAYKMKGMPNRAKEHYLTALSWGPWTKPALSLMRYYG